MRGPDGVVVVVIRYRDKMQLDRRCYRLSRHGVFVGEYKTPEELGKVINLAALARTTPSSLTAPRCRLCHRNGPPAGPLLPKARPSLTLPLRAVRPGSPQVPKGAPYPTTAPLWAEDLGGRGGL